GLSASGGVDQYDYFRAISPFLSPAIVPSGQSASFTLITNQSYGTGGIGNVEDSAVPRLAKLIRQRPTYIYFGTEYIDSLDGYWDACSNQNEPIIAAASGLGRRLALTQRLCEIIATARNPESVLSPQEELGNR